MGGRWYHWCGWLIVGLFLAARVHLLWTRVFDPDEFEHLHASYCIFRGMAPYRDFFEHHGPATYYVGWLPLLVFGDDPFVLLANRIVSLVLILVTYLVTWHCARRIGGAAAGLAALVWLSTLPWFAEKSIEWRPDVPAVLFVMLGVWFATGRASRISTALAGFYFALGLLCTQKAVFLVAGAVAGVVVQTAARRRSVRATLACGLAGAAIPFAVCIGWFAFNGALDDLVRCTLIYPSTWPADVTGESSPVQGVARLFTPIAWAPGHLGLAATATLLALVRLCSGAARRKGEAVYLFSVAAHLCALPLVKAVYLQFYLLALPLLAVLVGRWVAAMLTKAVGRRGLAWVGIMLTIVFVIGLWPRADRVQGLVRDFNSQQFNAYDRLDLLCVALLATGFPLLLLHRKAAVVLLIGTTLLAGAGRVLIPNVYWPDNTGQLANVRLVNETIRADQSVLDGFSGLGCLRPHAYYFWWINHHSLRLIEREGRLGELRAVVANGEPAAIVFDSEINKLRGPLGPVVAARYAVYRKIDSNLYLMLRKDLLE